MTIHPDTLRPDFERACLGWTQCSADQLHAVERDLTAIKGARSLREFGILLAIRDAIAFPEEWEKLRKPLVLKTRPAGVHWGGHS